MEGNHTNVGTWALGFLATLLQNTTFYYFNIAIYVNGGFTKHSRLSDCQ